MVFTSSSQLAKTLRSNHEGDAIIGVDGWTGVGKTTLATELAEAGGGRKFDLDCALIKDQNCYVPALRMEEIQSSLSGSGLLFVSGICLLQVLELAGVEASAHVYVKRMASGGWADEDDLLGKLPEFPSSSGEPIRNELRNYHRHWKPHLTATYEFHSYN